MNVRLDFAAVLAANQSMVFSLAVRFVRNRAVAEELSQDVFLQCYRQFDRIESDEHATGWLRRAICHRSIDETRKRKIRPQVDLDDIPELAAKGEVPDVFLRERLHRMIGSLPDKARMVVLLRYQEDLDPSEISELLDIPVSTVKSLLHRTLALLRGKFQKQEVCR